MSAIPPGLYQKAYFYDDGSYRAIKSREVPNFMKTSGRARIITKHEVQYPDPIEVVAGETVHVGDEDREYP